MTESFDPSRSTPKTGRAVAAATLSTALGVLPVFLLGGMAVLIRSELDFGEVQLGFAVAAFFAASALFSVPAGIISQRLGPSTAMKAAALITTASLVGISALGTSWLTLVVFLLIAGAAGSLAQLSAYHLLAEAVPLRRQGLAFGTAQSAVPLAAAIAGALLPLVGLTIGWRWAFSICALLAAPVLVVAGGRDVDPRVDRHSAKLSVVTPSMVLLTVGTGFASAASMPLATFVVESLLAGGSSANAAGILLAMGSLVGISSRLVGGWAVDRLNRGLLLFAAALLATGAVGLFLLALGPIWPIPILAVIVAFGGAWGWPGLMFLAIARANQDATASAIGLAQVGAFSGSVSGPLVFGVLVESTSYSIAWLSAGVAAVVAVVLILVGRHFILPELRP